MIRTDQKFWPTWRKHQSGPALYDGLKAITDLVADVDRQIDLSVGRPFDNAARQRLKHRTAAIRAAAEAATAAIDHPKK